MKCRCNSQGVDPTNFSLVEVSLDRGVSEREMGGGEYPWVVIQQLRKVGVQSVLWMARTRMWLISRGGKGCGESMLLTFLKCGFFSVVQGVLIVNCLRVLESKPEHWGGDFEHKWLMSSDTLWTTCWHFKHEEYPLFGAGVPTSKPDDAVLCEAEGWPARPTGGAVCGQSAHRHLPAAVWAHTEWHHHQRYLTFPYFNIGCFFS